MYEVQILNNRDFSKLACIDDVYQYNFFESSPASCLHIDTAPDITMNTYFRITAEEKAHTEKKRPKLIKNTNAAFANRSLCCSSSASIWEAFSPEVTGYCVGSKSCFCEYIKHYFVSLCAANNLSCSCCLFLMHVPALYVKYVKKIVIL